MIIHVGRLMRNASFGALLSGASSLLSGETQGLALDFTDDFWQPTTDFYGSARVIDTGTPANNYDSSPTQAASSLLTYTSPSLKMTMGPSGVLRFGAHNLYVNSASPADQSITVVSGATYSVTITGTVSVTASGAATGTWTAGTQTFTAGTTTLTLGSTSGSGTVHVRRTPSDSTYLATGASARYALPFEWDSSGNLLGILVEEARTNLALYSEQFDNAAWTKDGATISANAGVAPDGQTTADKLVEDTTVNGSNHRVYLSLALGTATGTYTSSVYAKAAGRTKFHVRKPDGGNGDYVLFDLTAVTATDSGTGPTSTSSITDVGNGWYRCRVTSTTASSVQFFSLINLHNDAGNQTYTGDGSSGILIWGAQFESGAFPTSYIPTIGATATRAVDNISLATSAFPTAASMSMFARGKRSDDTSTHVIAALATDGNNWSGIRRDTTTVQLIMFNASALVAAPTKVGAWTQDAFISTAARFAANDTQIAATGAVGTADTSCTPPSYTALRVGDYVAGFGVFSGHIAKIMVVPRAWTDGELQTVTT